MIYRPIQMQLLREEKSEAGLFNDLPNCRALRNIGQSVSDLTVFYY